MVFARFGWGRDLGKYFYIRVRIFEGLCVAGFFVFVE